MYCSGIGWTEQSHLFEQYNKNEQFDEEELASVMCLSPTGDLPPSKICAAQRSGYDMCPTQDFTIDTIIDQVSKMADAGIDYIQILDQNVGGTSFFCYSENHGHPPTPGKWQSDAMIRLLKKLKPITADGDKKILLGCESAAAETYFPYLLFNDNRYNLNYAIGTPVPVYSYIYHTYINNFMGNQVCANIFDHERSPENLFYRYAYAFHADDMLTLVLTQDGDITWNWGERELSKPSDQERIINFIKNCNMWRTKLGKKYLHLGKMIKPYPIEASGKNRFHMLKGVTHARDTLLTSCWQASDGTKAQFIVNYNDYDISCSIVLNGVSEAVIYNHPEAQSGKLILGGGSASVTVKQLSSIMIKIMGM